MEDKKVDERISLIKNLIEKEDLVKAEELAFSNKDDLDNNAEINFLLGFIYKNKGNIKKALQFYNKSIKINPNLSTTYCNIANIYKEINDFNNAYKNYKKSLQLNPSNISTLINFSILLKDLQKTNDAIIHLKKVLDLEPNHIGALTNISVCYLLKQEFDKVGDYINKAHSLDSSNTKVLNILANYLKFKNNYMDAIKFYKQARDILIKKIIKIDCSDLKEELFDIRENLATCLMMVGFIKEGINEREKSSGYITMNINQSLESNPLEKSKNTDFIGSWDMNNSKFCTDLIKIFENNKIKQAVGEMGSGVVLSKKNSVDISIAPNNIKEGDFKIFNDYFPFLSKCLVSYCKTWPFLNKFGDLYIGTFNIQKYNTGGHFAWPHAERMNTFGNTRLFAWMTYLNDVEEGGETVFSHYNKSVIPKEGLTLIWPGEWTHAHYGSEVLKGNKYIITGWMEMHR